jgi:hypothetical protein
MKLKKDIIRTLLLENKKNNRCRVDHILYSKNRHSSVGFTSKYLIVARTVVCEGKRTFCPDTTIHEYGHIDHFRRVDFDPKKKNHLVQLMTVRHDHYHKLENRNKIKP